MWGIVFSLRIVILLGSITKRNRYSVDDAGLLDRHVCQGSDEGLLGILGFRVQGSRFRVQGSRFRVLGLGCRILGVGFARDLMKGPGH